MRHNVCYIQQAIIISDRNIHYNNTRMYIMEKRKEYLNDLFCNFFKKYIFNIIMENSKLFLPPS